jgi:aldose 1-epimerase
VIKLATQPHDPHTGTVMDVSTTQPCMVVYGDSIGANTVTGKGGKIYRNFYAMSFETEGYLDAVNHPNFASTVVTPQKPMHEVTVFKLSTT